MSDKDTTEGQVCYLGFAVTVTVRLRAAREWAAAAREAIQSERTFLLAVHRSPRAAAGHAMLVAAPSGRHVDYGDWQVGDVLCDCTVLAHMTFSMS